MALKIDVPGGSVNARGASGGAGAPRGLRGGGQLRGAARPAPAG